MYMVKDDYKQFIADLYHCSEIWGQKTTEEYMRIDIESWKKEFEDCPKHMPVKKCTEYWNYLCDMYPN